MKPAIDALSAYLMGQEVGLADWPITEGFDKIEAADIRLVSWSNALTLARPVVEQGGTVRLSFTDEDETTVLQSVGIDDWRLEGEPDLVSPQLAREEARSRWSTQELERVTTTPLDSARCSVDLAKERWSKPVRDATGRRVWIGVRGDAFVNWMTRQTWTGAARGLFDLPGALVLLADWVGPGVTAGSRLTLGDLSVRADGAPSDSGWPEAADAWIVRAAEVDLIADSTAAATSRTAIEQALAGMAVAAAASLIAEETEGEAQKPSRVGATTWAVPSVSVAPSTNVPIIALARWVTRDPNATRLAVARQIAAERIDDPFTVADAQPMVSAAEIAYQSAVSSHVQTALRTQLELERSFHEVDGRVSDARDALRGAVDQSVVRALTAGLGISVAALTVSEVRGWPTVCAAAAVAAYVLFTAWWILSTMRIDLTTRFDALHDVIKLRQLGLGTDVAKQVTCWKNGLQTRTRWAQIVLTVFAVAILGGGVVLGATLSRSAANLSHQPGSQSPATLTPQPKSPSTPSPATGYIPTTSGAG